MGNVEFKVIVDRPKLVSLDFRRLGLLDHDEYMKKGQTFKIPEEWEDVILACEKSGILERVEKKKAGRPPAKTNEEEN